MENTEANIDPIMAQYNAERLYNNNNHEEIVGLENIHIQRLPEVPPLNKLHGQQPLPREDNGFQDNLQEEQRVRQILAEAPGNDINLPNDIRRVQHVPQFDIPQRHNIGGRALNHEQRAARRRTVLYSLLLGFGNIIDVVVTRNFLDGLSVKKQLGLILIIQAICSIQYLTINMFIFKIFFNYLGHPIILLICIILQLIFIYETWICLEYRLKNYFEKNPSLGLSFSKLDNLRFVVKKNGTMTNQFTPLDLYGFYYQSFVMIMADTQPLFLRLLVNKYSILGFISYTSLWRYAVGIVQFRFFTWIMIHQKRNLNNSRCTSHQKLHCCCLYPKVTDRMMVVFLISLLVYKFAIVVLEDLIYYFITN